MHTKQHTVSYHDQSATPATIFLRISGSLALTVLLISQPPAVFAAGSPAQTQLTPPIFASPANNNAGPCFATANNGATIFDSADAKAVQDAVDAASAGGTVKVAGTCAGVQLRNGTNQTVFIDKALTLQGGYTPADWSTSNPQANPTVLDAQEAGRGIFATAAVTVSHLTAQNGIANKGGGAFFTGETSIIGATFTGNKAINDSNGGGAWFDSAAIVIDASFTGNQADYAGGGAFFNTTAVITGSTFTQNTAVKFHGGAAYIIGTAIVTGTAFLSNTAKLDAGGALFLGKTRVSGSIFQGNASQTRNGGGAWCKECEVRNTTFSLNTANSRGGGAYFSGNALLVRNTFAGNSSDLDAGGAYFAGEGTVQDSLFTLNTAGDLAAGAYFESKADLAGVTFLKNTSVESGGGAVFDAAATLTQTQFIDNKAGDNNLGGGAFFLDAVTMNRVTFSGNSAGRGGGAQIRSATAQVRIVNSLFAGNIAVTGFGNQLYLFEEQYAGGTADILFSTFAAPALTAGSAIYTNKGTVNITNTIVVSHTVGMQQNGEAVVNEEHNLFYGNTANTAGIVNSSGGTVNADPAFVNPDAGNYRLLLGSPAIDAGVDLGEVIDLDGTPRPTFAGYDIGAFERGIPPNGLLVTATTTAPPLQPVTHLTATLAGGTEPLVYTWDLGDGSPVVTSSVTSHVYAPKVYTATATAINPYGVITASVQIFVPYRLLASIIVREAPLPLLLQRRR